MITRMYTRYCYARCHGDYWGGRYGFPLLGWLLVTSGLVANQFQTLDVAAVGWYRSISEVIFSMANFRSSINRPTDRDMVSP